MTKTKKVFDTFTRLYTKENKKNVVNVITVLIAVFMFFSVSNAYAISSVQEALDSKIDLQQSFQEVQGGLSAASGDDAPNLFNTGELGKFGSAIGVLQALTGTDMFILDGAEAAKVNPSNRYGLIGMAESGTMALYQNYPSINISEHIAKQWVPGYDQSVRSTIAAEDGFQLLTNAGLDELWEKTRMIAYILFVVILMAAGFMIMFRQKIGGQVMITVFNTLPGVVVGLVLVTFSFAIVGVVLNFAMVLVSVVGNLLDPSGQSLISANGPFSLLHIKNIGGFITGTFSADSMAQWFTLGGASIVGLIAGVITLATGGSALVIGSLAAVIFIIFVAFIVLWASVKVYITVLTAYIGIVLDTVLAPFYLVAAALPGKEYIGFDWFKRILRNALAFPLVFFFINLGAFILKSDINFSFPSGLVGGTTTGVDTFQNFGVGLFIKALLSIILFFVAAESPKFLLDILPTNGGKGAEAVMGGTRASLQKIPILGSFFG